LFLPLKRGADDDRVALVADSLDGDREVVEVLRHGAGGYDDFAAGNIDGVIARLHDDVEWVEPGGDNAP
jgi:hypothetical protein